MRSQRGFTLVELLVVIAIVAILSAIAVPLYANTQGRARVAKGQSDTRAIASAVSIYVAHCGGLPDNTSAAANCPSANSQNGDLPSALTRQQTNAQGVIAGPFLNSLPALPMGWVGSGASYRYASTATGTFIVCGSGDATVASAPTGTTCP